MKLKLKYNIYPNLYMAQNVIVTEIQELYIYHNKYKIQNMTVLGSAKFYLKTYAIL